MEEKELAKMNLRPSRTIYAKSVEAEKLATFMRALAGGASIETGCALSGISEAKVKDWLDKAAKGDPECRNFAKEVLKQQAQVKITLENTIIGAALKGDWKAAKTWLESKYPKEWGPHAQHHKVEFVKPSMTTEDFVGVPDELLFAEPKEEEIPEEGG